MLDLYELEQFSAFGECGTLSGARSACIFLSLP